MAPDLKAHRAKLDGVQKQIEMLQKQCETTQKHMEILHDATMKNIDAFLAEMHSKFALLRANNQFEIMRQVSPIRGRMSIVEARAR